MATIASIAKRRSEAETAIKDAVSALAAKAGITLVDPEPYAVRDTDLRRVVDMEAVAAQLNQILDGFAAKANAAKPEVKVK